MIFASPFNGLANAREVSTMPRWRTVEGGGRTNQKLRCQNLHRSHLNSIQSFSFHRFLFTHTCCCWPFFLDSHFFSGKLMFDIVQCDIVHDVGTFAGRATNTQHGQSHKVIQVRYIKVHSFVSMVFSSMLRSAQKASCRAKISNWWLVVV